jgi:hypothetical protein
MIDEAMPTHRAVVREFSSLHSQARRHVVAFLLPYRKWE